MRTEPTIISRAQWTTQAWKNGGGITHEVFRWRAPTTRDMDAFDLRVSVAEVSGAQPFSLFPGFWRTLIALEDNDLRLADVAAGRAVPMSKHHAFHFSGDAAMATEGTGRALDFNVMSRAGNRAHVEVSRAESNPMRARNLIVFALGPTTLREEGGAQHALHLFDALIAIGAEADVTYSASAPVVWVRF